MINEIEISNFRGIQKLSIKKLSNINILVGENNSGKTSILEAVFLSIGISNSKLPININTFRNFHLIFDKNYWLSYFKNLDFKNKIKITTNFDGEKKRELFIEPHNTYIDDSNSKVQEISSTNKIEPNGLILKAYIYNGRKKQIQTEVFLDKEGKIIGRFPKKYNEIKKGVFISSNKINSDLTQKFSEIILRKKGDELVRILQKIEPSLKSLTLVGNPSLIFADLGLECLVPLQLLGDGIGSIFRIILSIMTTEDGIVLIDEIENGLYFKSQKILWKAILEFSKNYNVQLIVSTHSFESLTALIETLDYKENICNLYRIEKKGLKHKAISFNQKEIKSFVESNWEIR
jgi:AAA15 family ATPase/GTPase